MRSDWEGAERGRVRKQQAGLASNSTLCLCHRRRRNRNRTTGISSTRVLALPADLRDTTDSAPADTPSRSTPAPPPRAPRATSAQVQLRHRRRPPGEGRQLQRRASRPVQGTRQAPQDGQAEGPGDALRHRAKLRRVGVRAAVQRARLRLADRTTRPLGERRARVCIEGGEEGGLGRGRHGEIGSGQRQARTPIFLSLVYE